MEKIAKMRWQGFGKEKKTYRLSLKSFVAKRG